MYILILIILSNGALVQPPLTQVYQSLPECKRALEKTSVAYKEYSISKGYSYDVYCRQPIEKAYK